MTTETRKRKMPKTAVLSAPLREWLLENYPTLGVLELSREIGLHERTTRAIVFAERPSINLTLVDQVFTHLGSPYLLDELYPLDEAASAV
jgi:hypothetical protein